jgi:DNA invertase Pin-like site-specific DNA recombinase
MFQMLGVFAEFERAMIRERVVAGVASSSGSGSFHSPYLSKIVPFKATGALRGLRENDWSQAPLRPCSNRIR